MQKTHRKYRALTCKQVGLFEEAEFVSSELNTDIDNILCITDVTDEYEEWFEELYDETYIGFPKREKQEYQVELSNGLHLSYWYIDVPNVGKGILVQDASPMGIYFKKSDLDKSNLNIVYEK
jgi:hypothetical protein